jgi:hypothetical protein
VQDYGAPTKLEVLGLSISLTGSGTPSVLTAGTPTFYAYGAITSDSKGQLYAAGTNPDGTAYIKVFAAGASGYANPVRAFSPPFTGNMSVTSMTTDATGNLLTAGLSTVTAGLGTVAIFPPTASPTDTEPTNTISLPSGEVPVAVAVDGSENIYVACNSSGTSTLSGSIFVYPAGGGSLLRAITTDVLLAGIAVDAVGNIFAVENTSATNAPGVANTVTLAEFAAGATGAAKPAKTISGSATGMTFGGAVTLDSVGNIYFVNSSITGTTQSPVTTPSVLIFGPTASGNEPPAVTLTSAAWTLPGSQVTVQ